MARRPSHCRIGEGSAVHKKDIEPAVIIEVEEEAARAHNLWEVLGFAGTVNVREGETPLSGEVAELRQP